MNDSHNNLQLVNAVAPFEAAKLPRARGKHHCHWLRLNQSELIHGSANMFSSMRKGGGAEETTDKQVGWVEAVVHRANLRAAGVDRTAQVIRVSRLRSD